MDQIDEEEEFEQAEGQMRKFMNMIRGEIDRDNEENVETAASHYRQEPEQELPAWMKGGLFDPRPNQHSNGVSFEPDTPEEMEQHKKDKKHHKKEKKGKHHKFGKKDKKDHEKKDHHKKKHCCAFVPLCAIVLVAGHLFQLRKLGNSLQALQALGGDMCGYRKAQKEKKAAAAAASTAIVADEEQVSAIPQNIEYSFDEHLDKEEVPIISQPINYTINESSTQMQ